MMAQGETVRNTEAAAWDPDHQPDVTEFALGVKERLYNWPMRVAREARGWRQRDLAERVGCSVGSISQYEALRHYPPEHLRAAIATALALPVDVLFPAWLKMIQISRTPAAVDDIHLSGADMLRLQERAGSMVKGGWEDDVDDAIDRASLPTVLSTVLDTLSEREHKVLAYRYGLEGEASPHTLDATGEAFRVTRERIRQIEAKAIRKMRHPSRRDPLQEWLPWVRKKPKKGEIDDEGGIDDEGEIHDDEQDPEDGYSL